MRRALGIAVTACAVLAAPAGAVGPWPGTVSSVTSAATGERFSVTSDGSTTELVAHRHGAVAKANLPGSWRIPAVTSTQLPGGLSPDGRLLVLVQQGSFQGLRQESKLLLVSTRTLKVRKAVSLRGEFGFDAVSPDRKTLYVIGHRNSSNLNEYIVRAYDIPRGTLLARPIVAKDEGVSMAGYPIARATTTSGAWVYTLYWRGDGTTFVHALATSELRAVCLDLTWKTQNAWQSRLSLSPNGRKLFVRDQAGNLITAVPTPA
jgi:hypothetical protein